MKRITDRFSRPARTAAALLAVLALATVAACATHGAAGKYADAGKKGPPSGAAGVPADWVGHQLGLTAPDPRPAGRVELVAEEAADRTPGVQVFGERPPGATASDEPATPAPRPGAAVGVVAINVASGEAFTESWDAAAADRILRALSDDGVPRSLGAAAAAGPSDEPRPPGPSAPSAGRPGGFVHADLGSAGRGGVAPASWSDGVASFVRLGIAEGYGANHTAYRSIGQIGSACSGTLIGPRHVITAAHCVVDRVNQVAYNATFRPRRDWSEGTISPTAPYGSRSFVWYYFPLRYWDGVECDSSSSCNQYDIALGILSSDMPVPYMGYWYAPISTLDDWTKYNRGYPRCFGGEPDAEAPRPDPPCQRSTLFGDAQTCQIGDWRSVGPDGYNRELFVNCDGARGMSGSPMYRYHDNGVPVVLGVYSQYMCTAERCAGDPNGEYPNIFTRVTPESAGWIASSMSLWSCSSGFCAPTREAAP